MKIPIDIKTGNVIDTQSKELIVGIDLGTTNSLIAIANTNQPTIIHSSDGTKVMTPSIIYLGDKNVIIVGDEAKKYLDTHPQQTIYSIKRLLGKSFNDLRDWSKSVGYEIIDGGNELMPKIKVRDRVFNPIELSSYILKQLKKDAEIALKASVNKAVITVPAYFNDSQRQATREAGKLAGLEVVRIINEPTAAALAYGISSEQHNNQTIAVYDLGGGTFDISILRLEDGIFEVLSTQGDTFLGGDDIDNLIVNYWLSMDNNLANDYKRDINLQQQIRITAEKAKVLLSYEDQFKSTIRQHKIEISKNKFIQLIDPIIEKTITICKQSLIDAKIEVDNIDSVLLVGGSTRLEYLREKLSVYFGNKLNTSVNPDQVVALGAAIQADILAGNRKDILLLDITPLSLGIETVGGLMDIIIPRNTKVPCRVGRQYTTSIDAQSNLRVTVFQGERDLVINNRKLGECILKGIPSMPAGIPKIEIQFILDPDGILTVNAKELRSDLATSIEIKSSYGITEEEMALMLLDSLQNADADKNIRSLRETINEGNSILLSTEKFITQNSDWLEEDTITTLRSLHKDLHATIQLEDKNRIEHAISELNQYAAPFAHLALDRNIGSVLKGKNL